MSIVKHAVIAAAGLGSRLGHGKPKCLVEVGGVMILKHLLHLVKDVEDVRVVVGFEEKTVISEIVRIRPDVLVVRNPGFRSTTTLHSYELGARHLSGDCLFMDGDMLIEPDGFAAFLATCRPGVPRLGITKAKTLDAVFTTIEGGAATAFSRNEPTTYEWANISWLPIKFFSDIGNTAVYEHLRQYLPMDTMELTSYEIDNEHDLSLAKQNLHHFDLAALAS
ncbi:Choline kinase [Pseudoxanthobacter soli DSM 19599]|uniref:Choline kinase n=1 Tax=Pseudoxanthobacter soli DSM 19599 TaxID=1123029 RepID=A0A1M7Z7R1_9HYPH|nr:NTP transferase domain-containing protein [Pseudoxanthobacter soli]SHO60967.1 Choline kinase [Pseudoxanthobacter soli DSM 19599]